MENYMLFGMALERALNFLKSSDLGDKDYFDVDSKMYKRDLAYLDAEIDNIIEWTRTISLDQKTKRNINLWFKKYFHLNSITVMLYEINTYA